MNDDRTYYEILGISPYASLDEINRQYHIRMEEEQPRRNANRLIEADQEMERIKQAFKILSNPEERAEYDELLRDMQTLSRSPIEELADPPPHDSRRRHSTCLALSEFNEKLGSETEVLLEELYDKQIGEMNLKKLVSYRNKPSGPIYIRHLSPSQDSSDQKWYDEFIGVFNGWKTEIDQIRNAGKSGIAVLKKHTEGDVEEFTMGWQDRSVLEPHESRTTLDADYVLVSESVGNDLSNKWFALRAEYEEKFQKISEKYSQKIDDLKQRRQRSGDTPGKGGGRY